MSDEQLRENIARIDKDIDEVRQRLKTGDFTSLTLPEEVLLSYHKAQLVGRYYTAQLVETSRVPHDNSYGKSHNPLGESCYAMSNVFDKVALLRITSLQIKSPLRTHLLLFKSSNTKARCYATRSYVADTLLGCLSQT